MALKDFENQILKKSKPKEIPVFKTEFLDIPKCSIIELRGLHNSGIVKFSINLLNNIQNQDGQGLYVDADYNLDHNLINHQTLLLQPQSPQETFDILSQEPLLKYLSITVIDSVLNLLPLNGDYTQFDQNLKLLREKVKKNRTILIILNPYLSNKANMLSKYTDIIIVMKRVKTLKKEIKGQGKILKNLVNLNCEKFDYTI